jgi:hypothetical protein
MISHPAQSLWHNSSMKNKLQKYLGFVIPALAVSLLMHPALLSQENSYKLTIAAGASKTKFDPQQGFNSPIRFGGQITYSLFERLGVTLSLSSFSTKKTYEVIGDLEELNVATHIYQLKLQYLLFNATPSVRFYVNSGFGVVSFTTPERKISLGGFGQMTMPEKSDISELFSSGITITKQISPRINVHFTPEIFMFKSDRKVRTNSGLEGGIGVGIL